MQDHLANIPHCPCLLYTSIKVRLSKAEKQLKEPTITEGKQNRIGRKGKAGMEDVYKRQVYYSIIQFSINAYVFILLLYSEKTIIGNFF